MSRNVHVLSHSFADEPAGEVTFANVVDSAVARVCAAIADARFAIVRDFLPAPVVASLAAEARFRDDDARMLSCVLYLNDAWTAADGGALRIYLSPTDVCDVLPVGGTLVCFLSDRYEHEVLPATRERLAITGWFRRRSLRHG